MKKILVTQIISENSEYYELRQSLDINWASFLKTVGVIPIPISYNFNLLDYFQNLEIEGILLTGGNSLSDLSGCSLSQTRDNFELSLIEESISRKIPLIGVCRGMQIIAKYFNLDIGMIKGHVATNHQITFEDQGRYFKGYKKIKFVNSFHKYAIKTDNRELTITSRSNDNSIESFEHKIDNIIGIMWHPERYNHPDLEDVKLFKRVWSC